MGLSQEEAQEKFGFLLDAFAFGAPPHGGIAFGWDRIVALLAGTDSIRDVIAFPKSGGGYDPLTAAPAPITPEQRKEAGVDAKPGRHPGAAAAGGPRGQPEAELSPKARQAVPGSGNAAEPRRTAPPQLRPGGNVVARGAAGFDRHKSAGAEDWRLGRRGVSTVTSPPGRGIGARGAAVDRHKSAGAGMVGGRAGRGLTVTSPPGRRRYAGCASRADGIRTLVTGPRRGPLGQDGVVAERSESAPDDVLVHLRRARDVAERTSPSRSTSRRSPPRPGCRSSTSCASSGRRTGSRPSSTCRCGGSSGRRTCCAQTNLTVTEVCHAVGFSSLGSFSSRFRAVVGESPAAF